jgi:hypothetical protein
VLVEMGVEEPRRRIGLRVDALAPGPGGVEQEEIARLDAREVGALRVQEELLAIVADRGAEVVGHRFVHAQARRPAERRRELDPTPGLVGR